MDYLNEFVNSKEFLSLPPSARQLALIFIGIQLSQAFLKYWYEHIDEIKKSYLRLK